MLDALKLRVVWLIIEQRQGDILPGSSDSEIIQQILEQLQEQILLSTSELSDTQIYIQSRIPVIRDLAEIQFVNKRASPQL